MDYAVPESDRLEVDERDSSALNDLTGDDTDIAEDARHQPGGDLYGSVIEEELG